MAKEKEGEIKRSYQSENGECKSLIKKIRSTETVAKEAKIKKRVYA